MFPTIIRTGFFVDECGLLMSFKDYLIIPRQALPAAVIVFTRIETCKGKHALGMALVDIIGYSAPSTFASQGPYYGEGMPGLTFVRLNVRDVPVLRDRGAACLPGPPGGDGQASNRATGSGHYNIVRE